MPSFGLSKCFGPLNTYFDHNRTVIFSLSSSNGFFLTFFSHRALITLKGTGARGPQVGEFHVVLKEKGNFVRQQQCYVLYLYNIVVVAIKYTFIFHIKSPFSYFLFGCISVMLFPVVVLREIPNQNG